MKKKPLFYPLLVVYVLGQFLFTIFGGFANASEVSSVDKIFRVWYWATHDVNPLILTLSSKIVIWIIASFFLVLFILWQTDLKDQKLNRYALICEGANIFIIVLLYGISQSIAMGSLSFLLIALIAFILIVGLGTLIGYFVSKRNDASLGDIYTEDELAKLKEERERRRRKEWR